MDNDVEMPFVLRHRQLLGPEPQPESGASYDPALQLWVSSQTGTPIVTEHADAAGASEFGETITTKTREGIDASEATSLTSSLEIQSARLPHHIQRAVSASNFGETINTATREGIDQSERSG